MQYGFIIPVVTDARTHDIVDFAREAEAAGWDALFYWDGDWAHSPWITLAAMAVHTSRIRIGAILHPLAWRQPWLFARETATLDQLCDGRLTVSVGLGAVMESDWERGRTRWGLTVDRKVRAQLLDEGLAITNRLWSGEAVNYEGEHYQIADFTLTPTPVQQPRIPIWAVGVLESRKSMARVLGCDGMLIDSSYTPEQMTKLRSLIAERPVATPFDIVMEADTRKDTPEEARAKVQRWSDEGVTWWTESMWIPDSDVATTRARIAAGPPRIEA